MKSISHKSQQVNELNNSIPTIPQFSLIGKFPVWLTIILSACWRLIIQTTRDKCNFNLLPAFSKERLEKRNPQELEQTKQAKFGIKVKEVVNANLKHLFTVIVSLGQLCANAGCGLIQRFFVKFKYLMGLVFLTAVILFHPPSNMYSYAGIGEESKSLNSGYDSNFTNQGFNSENTKLFNFDNSAVGNSLERMLNENAEIKIDTNPDPLSPSADTQIPIQLAQSTPEVTFHGLSSQSSFTLSNYSLNRTLSELPNNVPQTINSQIFFLVSIPDNPHGAISVNYTVTESDSGGDYLIGTTGTRTLNFATAQTSTFSGKKFFRGHFFLDNDHVDEPNGVITFTLQAGTGYTLSSTRSTTLNVTDNDDPPPNPLTLVGAGGGLSTTESDYSKPYSVYEPTGTNERTVYFLIHFPFTNSRNFDIKYRVTQGANENFIVGTTTADRTLNPTVENTMSHGNQASGMTKIYTVGSFKIQNDSTRNTGSITLTLKAGTGYALPAVGERSITINVTAPPLVTLVGAGGTDSTMESDYSRTFNVTEGGDTGTTTVYFLMHIPSSVTADFTIDYELIERPMNNFLRGATNSTVDGSINLATAGIDATRNNKKYIKGSFELTNDNVEENATAITFTLEDGTNYDISATAAETKATINVMDDDGPPLLTLVGAGTTNSFTEADFRNPATVTEGNSGNLTVYFLMHLPADVTSNFMINYSLVERDIRTTNEYANDDFLADKTADRTLNLATSGVTSTNSGKRYIKGSFEIKNDTAQEENGQIILTLKTSSARNYSLSDTAADNKATINVSDNDNSTPLVTLVGVSSQSSFLFDRVSRTLNISELNFQINFFVSIAASANKNITVEFDFSQRPNDNFISATQLDYYYPRYDLSAATSQFSETHTSRGKSYFRGTVDIDNDDVHEENGVLTFSIKPGTGYALSSIEAERSATINVMDNDSPSDKPLVNLVGVGGTQDFLDASYSKTYTATEGDTGTTPVYFLMYIPGNSSFASSISYQLDQGSNSFLAPNQSTSISVASASTTTRDGRKYIRGSFNIANDTVDEANGDITFTLQGGTTYAVSGETANKTATITVADNDRPKISITRGSATATEGTNTSVSFTLSATPEPIQDLTITINVSENGNMISAQVTYWK